MGITYCFRCTLGCLQELLNQFGNLENILENAEQIEKPSIRKSIMESKDRLQKNYQIIKLTARAEIPFMLEELKCNGERLKKNNVWVDIGLI